MVWLRLNSHLNDLYSARPPLTLDGPWYCVPRFTYYYDRVWDRGLRALGAVVTSVV